MHLVQPNHSKILTLTPSYIDVRQQPCHAVQNNTRYWGNSSNVLEHLFHTLIQKIGYGPQYLLCRGVAWE